MDVLSITDLALQFEQGRRNFDNARVAGAADSLDLSRISLEGADITGLRLHKSSLRDANISRCNAGQATFTWVDLSGADLSFSRLKDCVLAKCTFDGTRLEGASIEQTLCIDVTFPPDLRLVSLAGSKFEKARMPNVDLSKADISGCSFTDCDLKRASLIQVNCADSSFARCDLNQANLSHAHFANTMFSSVDLRYAKAVDTNFRRATFREVRFDHSTLRGADLSQANLSTCDVSYADMSGAALRGSKMFAAKLIATVFADANLEEANLDLAAAYYSDFTNANLEKTNLQRSVLFGALFAGASLTGAFLWAAELAVDQLSDAQLHSASLKPHSFLKDFGGTVAYRDTYHERNTHAVVRVYYATDRARTVSGKKGEYYSSGRAPHLEYGTCQVSIPRDHRMGSLEAPSIFRLQFKADPEKHVMVEQIDPCEQATFWRMVKEDQRPAVLLFVHGYNVSFNDAVRRTGQIAYDLGLAAVPVCYSWPSRGELSGYFSDEAAIEWTADHLHMFVETMLASLAGLTLNIVAHSMGNRAVLRLLELLRNRGGQNDGIGHVALTAPDVDSAVFEQRVIEIRDLAKTLTLYASSRDNALLASYKLRQYPRAGQAGKDVLIIEGLDTIDASDVDTEFLGHSYFSDCKSVLSDIFYSFRGLGPRERHGLERIVNDAGHYWRLRA